MEIAGQPSHKFLMSIFLLIFIIIIIISSTVYYSNIRITKESKFTTKLSLMTYPIYLIHIEGGYSIIKILYEKNVSIPISFLLAFGIIMSWSYFIVSVFEPYFKKVMYKYVFVDNSNGQGK
jgi:peptidoglycan/LPS O-acetylase OafA/YrhL